MSSQNGSHSGRLSRRPARRIGGGGDDSQSASGIRSDELDGHFVDLKNKASKGIRTVTAAGKKREFSDPRASSRRV